MCWARGMKRTSPGFASFIAPDLGGNLVTLGQICHATLEMNDYYPLIARAVERLDRGTGEARRAVYERARKAVAQLRSNQPALLDADITKERIALEVAILKVEAEAERNSRTEIRAEPRSAAPSEGMPDGDKIQSRDHLQPASPDRDDRPPALSIFLPTASDDHHNADIQAVAIGGAYGADHYYDDVPGWRWRGGLLVVMAVLALAMLAGTFAYRAFFGGYVFPALPPIVIAGAGPNDIVQNNGDYPAERFQTSVRSAGWGEKLQSIDIREAPKTEPRVISTIAISSRPSAGPVAPAPAATAPALDPPVASALDHHVAPSVPPPASAPVPVSASSEPSETAAVAATVPMPALTPPMLRAAPVPSPASAPVPVPASSEPSDTAAVAAAAPMPALTPPMLTAAPVPSPASAPVPVPASSEPKEIHTIMVAPVGRGGTATPSPPALAPHSSTRVAVRQNAAAASAVGNQDAAPSPSSRSPMQAGRGTAMEASSGGAYAVQLTSERSAAEAHASFRALQAKFPNQLGGREPIVRRTDLGAKGIYYRTMVGPFASMEKAAGMCRTLKAAGGNCLIQRR